MVFRCSSSLSSFVCPVPLRSSCNVDIDSVRLPILESRQVTWLTDPQKLGLLQSSTWHLGLFPSPPSQKSYLAPWLFLATMSGVEKRRSFNDVEKTDMGYDASVSPTKDVGLGEDRHIRGLETSAETSLHRGLKARHITMIAIGGAIGTGLIIGTGKALAQAGPGSVFICYTLVGFVVFLVMAALGEMAAWLPMSAGFTGYASRFCDPSLGFALGWT